MSKSYYPTDRAGQIDWHNNFATEFPKVGANLGFSTAQITSAVNDSKYAVYLLQTLGPETDSESDSVARAVLEGQPQGKPLDLQIKPGSAPPSAVPPGIDTRRQARVEMIKANSRYTNTIGQQLRIVSTSGEFDPKSYKAELGQPRQTGPNTVTIPFRKAGGEVAGINLYRQGKGDNAPKLVGFFMRTPAIDTAPASSGKSEQRTYTARAVINDKEIGQPSDAVQATMTAA